MKKPVLALLALAAALTAALVWWLNQDQAARGAPSPRTSVAERTEPEAAPAALSAPERPEAAQVAADSAAAPATSAPKPDERRAVEGDGSGRRIQGRVLVPSGAPADDSLRVVALAQALSLRDVYGRDGALTDLATNRKRERVLGTAAVGSDGAFDLALGSPAEVWLVVDGRFLYSPRVQAAPAGQGSLELACELGGCLTGVVHLPPGTGDAAAQFAGMELALGPDSDNFSMSALATAPLVRREATPDAEGRFELRALPAGHPHALELDLASFADAKVGNLVFEPGRVREVELSLQVGASVRGKVLDPAGAPLAEVDVKATESAMWGFPGDELAETKTDVAGAFTLEHVAPGKCLLIAEREGYLESEAVKLELADGEERGGLVLSLAHGAVLAGRVRMPDGSAAAAAKVEVSFDPEALVGMGAFNAARGASGEAKSGPEGEFEVSGLGKGPFLVKASLERTAADGVKEKLQAKQSGAKPDTRDLELVLAVPSTLAGRVRDLAGAPVPKFHVRATLDSGVFFMSSETRDESLEDPEGDFVLRGLEAGKWKVEASADGFGPMAPVEVSLPRTDETPLELLLAPAATISGTVVDPRGTPVGGARVTLQGDPAQRIQRMRGDGKTPETTSLDDGSFLLGGLAPGASTIFAAREGFAASDAASVEASAENPARGVVLRLRAGGLVTGEVFGKNGKPAPGVKIIAQSQGNMETNIKPTDATGQFRFEHLAPGSWTFTALLEGAEVDSEGPAAEASASFLENMRFAMVQLEDAEEEHVVLGAPPKDPVLVHGQVRHGGQPLTSGIVSFVAEGSKGLEAMKIAPLGSEGRYQTELGAPGRYLITVQITPAGGAFQQNNVEFRETIPESERHELNFDLPLGAVRGTVHGPDRQPLASARVTLATDGGIESGSMLGGNYSEATTDDSGHYSFDYLRPGSYAVAAGGALFGGAFGGDTKVGRVVRAGLHVDEGRALEGVDFQLAEAGNIKGRVVDGGGAPVKDAALFVRDASGRLLDRFSMITSAADGSFTYTGVAPGEYQVSARAKGQASVESALTRVEGGGSASVELVLQAGTKLVIEVVDGEEKPLRARISVVDAQGREMHGMLGYAEIAAGFSEGFDTTRQTVGPLPPGAYTVTAVADDGKKASKPVNLDGQAERRLKLRIR